MRRELDWERAIGQKVQIYRNLNNGTMSIQLYVPAIKDWRVAGHITNCLITNVTFSVSDAGRRRAIRDGRKNVHAFGQGILLAQFDTDTDAPIDLAYDPFTDTSFVERGTERAITACSFLVVRNNLVFVSPDAAGTGDRPRPVKVRPRVQQQLGLFGFNRLALAA